LSSVDPKSGLLDSEKSLWRTSEEAIANVTTNAAEAEMRAQVQMALDSGIDVSHIDTHMGTVIYPKFLSSYLKIAREFNVAAFLPRLSRAQLEAIGLGNFAEVYLKKFKQLDNSGTPLIDHIIIDTMGDHPNKTEYYCKLFAEIKPGLTHFLFHPAKMSPELKAIAPDSASWRDLDYQAFTDPNIKKCVEKYNIKIIGYKEIRNIIREES